MAVGYAICNATLVWDLQAAEFGMVFAGDISDVMSDGEERLLFEACDCLLYTSDAADEP